MITLSIENTWNGDLLFDLFKPWTPAKLYAEFVLKFDGPEPKFLDSPKLNPGSLNPANPD